MHGGEPVATFEKGAPMGNQNAKGGGSSAAHKEATKASVEAFKASQQANKDNLETSHGVAAEAHQEAANLWHNLGDKSQVRMHMNEASKHVEAERKARGLKYDEPTMTKDISVAADIKEAMQKRYVMQGGEPVLEKGAPMGNQNAKGGGGKVGSGIDSKGKLTTTDKESGGITDTTHASATAHLKSQGFVKEGNTRSHSDGSKETNFTHPSGAKANVFSDHKDRTTISITKK
jgi:hypothetical protein